MSEETFVGVPPNFLDWTVKGKPGVLAEKGVPVDGKTHCLKLKKSVYKKSKFIVSTKMKI